MRCNGTFNNCNKLIRTKYTEYKYNFTSSSSFEFEQKRDYYDQIYLKKGSNGTLALALLMRSLIFIRLFLSIAKLFFFVNLAGPLKKVVYFIKNSDGTITDLKDINIVEEIQEKFKGNKKENCDGNNKNEKNKKSKSILLKQVILNKKIDPSLNRNLNYPINQNILANGHQTQVVYIDNNNLNNFIVTDHQVIIQIHTISKIILLEILIKLTSLIIIIILGMKCYILILEIIIINIIISLLLIIKYY